MIPPRWSVLHGLPVRPSTDGGLINQTFMAGDPPRFAVQRVNPLFGTGVQFDIDAVTTHLAARHQLTPRLVPTDAGTLWATADDGGVWRVMTWVPGRTVHRVTDPRLAAEAGRRVAEFHRALADFEWTYQNVRPAAHDTSRHMARLEAAAAGSTAPAAALAQDILGAWSTWQGALDLPTHHAHGDLKISNVRFDEHGHALCLIDLDTLARLPIDVELGDAWRSWSNPVGEDSEETTFDLEIFAASARSYLAVNPLVVEEREALVGGIERIALELSSRFCLDVFEDRYFGWSPERFPTRAAHNLFRARGQFAVAASVRARRGEAERVVSGYGNT